MPDQSFSRFTKDSKVVSRLFCSGDKCWYHEDGCRVPQVLKGATVKKLDRPRCGKIESDQGVDKLNLKITFPGCFYLKMNFAHAVFPEFLHMLKVTSTIPGSFSQHCSCLNIHCFSKKVWGVRNMQSKLYFTETTEGCSLDSLFWPLLKCL